MLFLSYQFISLSFLVLLVVFDPSNSVKLSLCHFLFNFAMGLISLVAPEEMLDIFEASLPIKTSILGAACFVMFTYVPTFVLSGYEFVLIWVEPLYCIFEVLQVINLSFLISRKIKDKIDIDQGFLQFFAILGVALILTWVALTGFLYYEIFKLTDFSVVQVIFISLAILVSIFWWIICLLSNREDSNLMNGMFLTLFITQTTKAMVGKSKHAKMRIASYIQNTSYFGGLITKAYDIQKRLSNYLSSFILGGNPGYNIASFFEFHKRDNIISLILAFVLLFTLPLTKKEWFPDEQGDQSDNESDKEAENRGKSRSFQYFLNWLLVLMVTNYSLRSLDYTTLQENYNVGIVSCFLVPLVGVGYMIYKLSISEEVD